MPADDLEYIARLFAREVPAIAEGTVVIKAIARKPRYRSKIAVYSHDPAVDCIAACVGMRGNRIARIVDELNGERIDLIRWDESVETLIANSLRPAALERSTRIALLSGMTSLLGRFRARACHTPAMLEIAHRVPLAPT